MADDKDPVAVRVPLNRAAVSSLATADRVKEKLEVTAGKSGRRVDVPTATPSAKRSDEASLSHSNSKLVLSLPKDCPEQTCKTTISTH